MAGAVNVYVPGSKGFPASLLWGLGLYILILRLGPFGNSEA